MLSLSNWKAKNHHVRDAKRKKQNQRKKPARHLSHGASYKFWIQAQAQIHSDATGDKESAHIKRDPGADKAEFLMEQEISTKMQLPEIQFNTCQASVTLQYHQRDTLVRVESTVENEWAWSQGRVPE